MSRRSLFVVELSESDRAVLEQRSRAYTSSFAEVVRARIVLLAADGEPNTAIAARLDVHVSRPGEGRGAGGIGVALDGSPLAARRCGPPVAAPLLDLPA